ncbi:MAG TPA: hypothetical protein VIW68_01570 [Candidatus Sulfotelmatobacter sp.]
MSFLRDLKVAFHSLAQTKGLAAIVIPTLSLGIGANAANPGRWGNPLRSSDS